MFFTATSFILATLLAPAVHANSQKPQACEPTVQVAQGRLCGSGRDVYVFKGIPYAEPPIKQLRWRPPRVPVSWVGPRDATEYGNACMQPQSYANISPAGMSEDCLYLNIWAPPRQDRPVPVMVWIHGGGFTMDAGSSKEFDGENLAGRGVIVVTIKYRLGVFGFLAHPDLTQESAHHASGNYGLMDQIAALRWVKKNIHAFGGDPSNVTMFGESAGATSIGYLIASPLASGLFQRAILESPSDLFLPDAGLKRRVRGLMPMEEIGTAIGKSIRQMRTWTAAEVMKRSDAITGTLFASAGTARVKLRPESRVHTTAGNDEPWWPFVDGWVVPQQLSKIYAENREMAVPVLVGVNANEGTIFLQHFTPSTQAQYRDYLQKTYFPCGDVLFADYSASTGPEIRVQADRLLTDVFFLYGARKVADAEKNKGQKAYMYRFSRVTADARLSHLGSWHGSEIPYIFGHTNGNASRVFDGTDHAISEEMAAAWVNFAKTGQLAAKHLPDWPEWQQGNERYMNFGNSAQVETIGKRIPFRIFDKLFSISGSGENGSVSCIPSQ
jgi:para-nitrobenzyl esterase